MKRYRPAISIVIPTLNEEKYLPKLLRTISNQTYDDYEVIVADAGSKDSTVKIAKEWGAKVVKGGKPGPGRNAGAKSALADKLFFFDADVELPDRFFELALDEIRRRNLDCATWGTSASDGDLSYKLLFEVLSKAQRVAVSLGAPVAGGYAIFCTKEMFNEVSGFDHKLYLAEDYDFIERVSKKGKFGFLKGVIAGVSMRRWQKEGGLKMGAKYMYSIIYMGLFGVGSIKTEIMDYEFGNYDNIDKKKFRERMEEFMKDLTDIEKIKSTKAIEKFGESLKKILPKNWSK